MKTNQGQLHLPNPFNTAYQAFTSLFQKKEAQTMQSNPANQQLHPAPTAATETASYNPVLPFDLSMLEEMDDNEYVIEIISIFLKETPYEMNELQNAVISNNANELKERAHKLKSSAGLIQANAFLDILVQLEETGKLNQIKKETITLVENAQKEYNSLAIALQRHRQMIQFK